MHVSRLPVAASASRQQRAVDQRAGRWRRAAGGRPRLVRVGGDRAGRRGRPAPSAGDGALRRSLDGRETRADCSIGSSDVLERARPREQVEPWNTNPISLVARTCDEPPANRGRRRRGRSAGSVAGRSANRGTPRRCIEGRLAGAGRPGQGDELAALHVTGYPAQGGRLELAHRVGLRRRRRRSRESSRTSAGGAARPLRHRAGGRPTAGRWRWPPAPRR